MKFLTLALMITASSLSFAGGENAGNLLQIKQPGYKKARQYAGEKALVENNKKKTRNDELRAKLLQSGTTSYSRF